MWFGRTSGNTYATHNGETKHPPPPDSNPLFLHTELQTRMCASPSGHSDRQPRGKLMAFPEASKKLQSTLNGPPVEGRQKPLLSQLSLQHCVSLLHFFPVGLQRG